ncbi:unnamed protein product [Pedinophyceae sp. YPF-701]|nr:unnamed protein product [Pedinophyceae sp. YPF-701]
MQDQGSSPGGPPQPKRAADQLRDTLAGMTAGATNIATGYPMDTVKVRMQEFKGHRHASSWECAKHIVRNEGFFSLYRGLMPPVIGGALETALSYWACNKTINAISGHTKPDEAPLPVVAAGAFVAGIVLSPVLSPMELLKCRMQTAAPGEHSGSLDCLRKAIRDEGWRVLLRGVPGTMAREMPGNAVMFTVYEGLQRGLGLRGGDGGAMGSDWGATMEQGRPRGVWELAAGIVRDAGTAVVCGGLAGMVMWGVVLPVDIAKTRIQVSHPASAMYATGVLGHMRHVVRTRGWGGLYAGIGPVMVRAFPANAAQWLAWEAVVRVYDDMAREGG